MSQPPEVVVANWLRRVGAVKIGKMNTLTTILEPQPDGTLHLPLPAELRTGKVEVTAILRAAPDDAARPEATSPLPVPRATPEMVRQRVEAFEALRAMGGLADQIPDPAAWQREIRQDRPLAGRD